MNSQPQRNSRLIFGGLASASLSCLLLAMFGAIPPTIGGVLLLAIALAWILAGLVLIVRKFGWRGMGGIAVLSCAAAAWFWFNYQHELAVRAQIAAIEELGPVSVITSGANFGSLWSGEIVYLYFDSRINEAKVLKILKSRGLDKLQRVVFKKTPISDETLAELAQMPSLRDIYIEGGAATEDGVESLSQALPECRVTIEDAMNHAGVGLGQAP